MIKKFSKLHKELNNCIRKNFADSANQSTVN